MLAAHHYWSLDLILLIVAIEMCNLVVEDTTLMELEEQQHHKLLTNIAEAVTNDSFISALENAHEFFRGDV